MVNSLRIPAHVAFDLISLSILSIGARKRCRFLEGVEVEVSKEEVPTQIPK